MEPLLLRVSMLTQFGLVQTKTKAVKESDVFGRLLVVATGQIPNTYRYYAVCQCECGAPPLRVRFDGLTSGVTTSCGCIHRDVITTHGLTESPHYSRWKGMMRRCYDEKNAAYKNYGGRGIKVHELWHDVAQFSASLPSGYFQGAHIDRINNDGDYEPGNIRWSTPKQNSVNKRNTKLLTFNGKTQSQHEWAEELGVTDKIIYDRINNSGWTVERALSTPVMDKAEISKASVAARWGAHEKKGRPEPMTARRIIRVESRGRIMTMAELSLECGVSAKDLRRRIVELGWPVERAIIK